MSDTYDKIKKLNILNILTSPLAGEVGFQCEQKPASIRKAGEGFRNLHTLFTPHPEFLKLVPRFEIHPSPTRGEDVHIYC